MFLDSLTEYGNLDGRFQIRGSWIWNVNVAPMGTSPESLMFANDPQISNIAGGSFSEKWNTLERDDNAIGPDNSILPNENRQSWIEHVGKSSSLVCNAVNNLV